MTRPMLPTRTRILEQQVDDLDVGGIGVGSRELIGRRTVSRPLGHLPGATAARGHRNLQCLCERAPIAGGENGVLHLDGVPRSGEHAAY